MNDLADRSFDRRVARTKNRPLASCELANRHAVVLLGLLLLAAASLLFLLDPLVLRLAPVALLLAALYPFSKRWLPVPQTMLGLAFGWGTVMAWAAVRGELETPAWCLFGATAAWAVAYDTIYAIQDREDDRRIGVKSAAIFFGSSIPLGVGIAFSIMLTFLGLAGWVGQIGWAYYVTLLGLGLFFSVQIGQLRGPVDPSHALGMFQAHTWVGVAVLTGLLTGFLT